MSKIIISLPMLGLENWASVAMTHAAQIVTEKGLDQDKIVKEINKSSGEYEFREVYTKYFGDEIKLRLT